MLKYIFLFFNTQHQIYFSQIYKESICKGLNIIFKIRNTAIKTITFLIQENEQLKIDKKARFLRSFNFHNTRKQLAIIIWNSYTLYADSKLPISCADKSFFKAFMGYRLLSLEFQWTTAFPISLKDIFSKGNSFLKTINDFLSPTVIL